VYVTHDQEEAMAVSDRIIVMRNAEIAQEGTPHDLYERPNSAFIADFIGDANLIPCQVISSADGQSDVEVAGQKIRVPNASAHSGGAQMVLRPHQFRLSKGKGGTGFEGSVTFASYLGNQIQYTIDSTLGQLFVISDLSEGPFALGDNVQVGFTNSDVRLVGV